MFCFLFVTFGSPNLAPPAKESLLRPCHIQSFEIIFLNGIHRMHNNCNFKPQSTYMYTCIWKKKEVYAVAILSSLNRNTKIKIY